MTVPDFIAIEKQIDKLHRSLDNGEPVGNRLHNVIGINSMPSQALQVCQASAQIMLTKV
jgi:hypothetical protein